MDNNSTTKKVFTSVASSKLDSLDPLSAFAFEANNNNNSNNNSNISTNINNNSSGLSHSSSYNNLSSNSNNNNVKQTSISSSLSSSSLSSPSRGVVNSILGAGATIDMLSEGISNTISSILGEHTDTYNSLKSNRDGNSNNRSIITTEYDNDNNLRDYDHRYNTATSNNNGNGNSNNTYASDDDIHLLTGEIKLMSLKEAYAQLAPGRLIGGVLFMTNYRMAFIPSPAHLITLATSNPSVYSWLNVPLCCIEKVEKEKRPKESRNNGITMMIICKDARQHRITIQNKNNPNGDYEIEKVFSVMLAYSFPNNLRHLFAFCHSLPQEPLNLVKVDPYDSLQEYSRLGVTDIGPHGDPSPWRVSTANKDFRLCSTYPQILISPRQITDEELFLVSNFRSGHRLPTLSWCDKETGATMWRSAQPKAGVSGSCIQDEKFLELISQSCSTRRNPLGVKKMVAEPILHIVDCRPKTSAMANRAAGAGYESTTNYPSCRLDFYDIGNIHVMRDSHRNLVSLLMNSSSTSHDINFSKQIEDTQWLKHIRLVIKASWDTAYFIRKGSPVLVHCSHGWDRTAQVCSVAQLFLDPYYRTFDGFKNLVEKEWISFGHPFQLRCAHGQDKSTKQDDQLAPIFLQFLDCVWQILHQNPHYFEFNARYLLAIADHIYSCRFGTFIFNCDNDRQIHNVKERCVDVWTYLHYNRHYLINPLYMDPNNEDTPTTHVLLPTLSQLMRNVTLWTDYYFRWSTLPTMISTPEILTKYLNENGNPLPSISSSSSSFSKRIKHPDLTLPVMVTCDDFWEAAYRMERHEKEKLQKNASSYDSIDSNNSSNNNRNNNGNNIIKSNTVTSGDQDYNKELELLKQEMSAYKSNSNDVISKLVMMLRVQGCDEDDLSHIMGDLYISKVQNDDDNDDYAYDVLK